MESKISLIFSKIGTTIEELMECSRSDFMGLSAQFKSIASDTNLFVQHTQSLLGIVRQMAKRCKEAIPADVPASPMIPRPNRNVMSINCGMAQIMDKTQRIKIHLKSLNQDLLTLKFLIASYQISDIDQPQQFVTNPELQENIALLGDFKLDTHCSYKQLHEAVANTISSLARINKANRPLSKAYGQMSMNMSMMHQCIGNAEEKFDHVEQLLEATKRDMASIITNLQYHDIIGQKIAHVQQAHETITSSEQELASVKSIASIQSAILIKANQEYQRSIESIVSQLKNIARSTTMAYSICNDMVNCYLQTFGSDAPQMAMPSATNIAEQLSEEQNAVESMRNGLSAIVEACNTRPEPAQQASTYIKQWLGHLAIEDTTMAAVPQQIATMFKEVEGVSHMLYDTLAEIAQEATELKAQYLNTNKNVAPTNLNATESQPLPSHLQASANSQAEIGQLHNENSNLRQQISTKVSGAINGIRYYDVFEQKISSITSMLNEVFQEISNGTATPDKLEQIKDMYTMQSEHDIHANIVDGADAQIDSADEDFGELELF